MKYMILIQSNPQFLERWEALSKEQREGFGRDHRALSAELAESGELVVSEGLADPALAKRVNELERVLPNLTRKLIIEGAGHWVQQERPDEVNAALVRFLREAASR